MSSLYRRQVLVLDLSKTGSCFGCIRVSSLVKYLLYLVISQLFLHSLPKTVVLTCFLKGILCQ